MPNPYCPFCDSDLKNGISRNIENGTYLFICPLCGEYDLTHELFNDLFNRLHTAKDAQAKIRHAISNMRKKNVRPILSTKTVEEILRRPLPSPKEQVDLLVRWLAENTDGPGEEKLVDPATHQSIIGAKTPDGFALISNYLFEECLVKGHQMSSGGRPGKASMTLSIKGWDYFEQLKSGTAEYHKAFMAMKFGIPELDQIVESVFKECVRQTGFELYRIDDIPRAGLIDDRLRVEIQSSDFLIADLTHDNLGAYWEAGYAEGLGKPVIYTCEKEKFGREKTHFDTNHHLTIVWDKENPKEAGERLKATIRATLPEIAKQNDA